MDIELLTDALCTGLRYASVEGSAHETLRILKAIKEVNPNLPWIDERMEEWQEKEKIEYEFLNSWKD
jgi:hypothetical protein